ncbi:energy transducer TonB [Puniceicoccaceae bacterium K14]|nr:energy transducer TonB [Puniceicoccaceae bacterium K14]
MNSDIKGPLILSACLHFVALVIATVYAFATPEKKPEPFVFEMYGDPGQPSSEPESTFKPIEYQSEDVEMPDPSEFEPEIPEPEPEPEPLPELDPAPELIEAPEPELPAEPIVEEKPKLISYKDFGVVTKPQNVPKNRPKPKAPDFSKDIAEMNKSLKSILASSSSSSAVNKMSTGDQRSLEAYFNSLKKLIKDNIETHSLGSRPLETEITFNLSANGSITNVSVSRSSGDSSYDAKVLAGVKRVRFFEPTPFGASHSLKIPFRQVAG